LVFYFSQCSDALNQHQPWVDKLTRIHIDTIHERRCHTALRIIHLYKDTDVVYWGRNKAHQLSSRLNTLENNAWLVRENTDSACLACWQGQRVLRLEAWARLCVDDLSGLDLDHNWSEEVWFKLVSVDKHDWLVTGHRFTRFTLNCDEGGTLEIVGLLVWVWHYNLEAWLVHL
jgi:hypothetical protein